MLLKEHKLDFNNRGATDEWPFYPRPFRGESFTGYKQRFAKENDISPFDVWSFSKEKGMPQKIFASRLEWAPDKQILLSRFAEISKLTVDNIHEMTFVIVLKKLDLGSEDFYKTRVLNGLFEPDRKFCPLCLNDKPFYRLIWQVKEIQICDRHFIRLISNCPVCKNKIPLLSKNAKVGFCPECESSLLQVPIEKANKSETENHLRLYEDWHFLLDPSKKLHTINHDKYNYVALTKLFLDLGMPHRVERNQIKRNSPEERLLYNIIMKNNKGHQKRSRSNFFHLEALLKTVREKNISFADFSKIVVPAQFIRDISNLFPSRVKLSELGCLAPWCPSFKKPGSLFRSTKTYVNNRGKDRKLKLKGHCYCTECGVQYGLDENDQLVERGYFIEIGWKLILPCVNKGMSIRQISIIQKIDRGKVKRCILFFILRGFVKRNINSKYLPENIDSLKVKSIKKCINLGYTYEMIRNELDLNYWEMIFYSSIPEITLTWLKRTRPCRKQSESMVKAPIVMNAIDTVLRRGEKICYRTVSSELGIPEGTLQFWKESKLVRDAAKKQFEDRRNKDYLAMKQKIDLIISKLISEGSLLVQNVYKELAISKNCIRISFRELYYYISQKVKDYKKMKKVVIYN